jgi:hypothetical protein
MDVDVELIKELVRALAKFGPWFALAGIAVWRAPQIFDVILKYWHLEREARRRHERNLNRFRLDLEKRRHKIQKRKKGRKG